MLRTRTHKEHSESVFLFIEGTFSGHESNEGLARSKRAMPGSRKLSVRFGKDPATALHCTDSKPLFWDPAFAFVPDPRPQVARFLQAGNLHPFRLAFRDHLIEQLGADVTVLDQEDSETKAHDLARLL